MADISKKTSRSATNSPIISQKRLLVQPPTLSHSVSNSPQITRSSRSRAQRLLENEKLQEEACKLLMNGQQKVVIIPMGKSGPHSNGRSTPKIKVCSTATNSSDSSDGKRTPPQRKRYHTQESNGSGGLSHSKSVISKQYSWRPNAGLVTQISKAQQSSPSLRSLKTTQLEKSACQSTLLPPSPSLGSFTYSDMPATSLRPLSDVVSVRSLISVGMGSTDGKKLVIRRVPTSPSDLLNFAHTSPCGETEDGFSSCSSFSGTLPDIHDYKSYRRYWPNKLQFILACVGYSIGLGNLWRFPYLCYKSGGGVFLIPYYLLLFMCGIPLLYMELAVGQFTRRGPIGALSKLCPIFKGAGISSVVVSFFLSTYYNVIIAYTLFYLFSSFRSDPPWGSCNNRWNSPNCWTRASNRSRPTLPKTPEEEFYWNKLLQSSGGFESFGQMRWELVACLFIVWVLVYFALWKSVRSSGKVLYFTATVPFALVLIFLGQALCLEGSRDGLSYLFSPKWDLLYDSKVWVYAAAQNFNSIGIAFGSIISFASYNKYNNQILFDTLTVSFINGVTSLLTAVFAFAVIGNIAWDQQEDISKVISDGPGLVFIVYPQFLYKMPVPFFWSSLFFFTLLCLCLNSQFAIVEVTVTSIQDGFPNWIKRKLVCHEILVLVVCLVSFIIGLPNVSQGGIYFFQLIDHYVASVSIIYIAFFEVIAVTWIYGTDRLSENIEKMTKYRPGAFFTTCWRVVTPLLLMCVWIFSLIDYKPIKLENYSYPIDAEILGWIFTSVTLISVPIFAVYVIINSDGDSLSKKLLNSFKPRIQDYCVNHSDGSQDHVKDVKELETLIESKIQENSNLNSNNSQLQNQPINNKENL